MERITFNGKQVYPREPKTQRFAKRHKGGKVIAIIMFVCFAVVGSYFTIGSFAEAFANWTVESIANAIMPEVHAENSMDSAALAKIIVGKDVEGLKIGVVKDIENCESHGDTGLIIFDTNNEASIGSLQFQRKTIQYYEKKLYGKDVSKGDAIAIAISKDDAESLAEAIIFQADGIENWLICERKINGEARVAAIKSLI